MLNARANANMCLWSLICLVWRVLHFKIDRYWIFDNIYLNFFLLFVGSSNMCAPYRTKNKKKWQTHRKRRMCALNIKATVKDQRAHTHTYTIVTQLTSFRKKTNEWKNKNSKHPWLADNLTGFGTHYIFRGTSWTERPFDWFALLTCLIVD